MNEKMHNVEHLMGELGRQCNTRLVERKMVNTQAWMAEVGANGIVIMPVLNYLTYACSQVMPD